MKPRVCIVVSSEMTVRVFLASLLRSMTQSYDVTVVVNTSNPRFLADLGIDARLVQIRIERNVAIVSDLRALLKLIGLLWRGGFSAVHSVTPKAGLLAMVGARLCRVPVRIHTFTGQVWATRTGLFRIMLRALDRVTAGSATLALVDSHSQREFLVKERVISDARSTVLLAGSVSGVDISRFSRDEVVREEVRRNLGSSGADVLLLFVGRMNRDKGVLDLARAFVALAVEGLPVRLTFVGGDEGQMRQEIESVLRAVRDKVGFIDFTAQPEKFMWAADVLCLPSYREGFGTVVIEAAVAGLPTVGSRIYGLTDAVVDGKTGLLHEVGSVPDLTAKLRRLIVDPEARRKMAEAATKRATAQFDQEVMTVAILRQYANLLKGAGHTGNDRLLEESSPAATLPAQPREQR